MWQEKAALIIKTNVLQGKVDGGQDQITQHEENITQLNKTHEE